MRNAVVWDMIFVVIHSVQQTEYRHSGLSGIGSKIQNDSRRAACGGLAGMTGLGNRLKYPKVG